MKTKYFKEYYTGKIYADKEVLDAVPFNEIQDTLEFFSLNKYVTDDELEKEYESRGLIPADIYTLANWCEANKDDRRKYFATHWKDAQGKWCYAAFSGWGDERGVDVGCGDDEWDVCWFFAGVRKALVPLELGRGWKYQLGDNVRKINGARWQGKVVGFYSSSLTERGYAVESTAEIGSVQIYPEASLEKI